MRACIIFICCTGFALVSAGSQGAAYTTKYDNVNIDNILNNPRVLRNYINCMLDKGPCTNEGRELKSILPDALKTECNKCSPKQKSGTEKVIRHMIDKHPNDWKKLHQKYDPQGIFEKRYMTSGKIFP